MDPARLAGALGRLRDKAGLPAAPVEKPARLAAEDKVFVREGERCWFVEVKKIRLLESEGNFKHTRALRHRPAAVSFFRSLNAMGGAPRPRSISSGPTAARSSTSAWIEKIEPWFSGGLLVHLKGGAKVELSRRQAQEFREKMSL